jgi:uroporphyrin-III C-methyltransferase
MTDTPPQASTQEETTQENTALKSTSTFKFPAFILWFLAALALMMAATALYLNQQLTQTFIQQSNTFKATQALIQAHKTGVEARIKAQQTRTETQEINASIARDALEKKLHTTLAEYHHTPDDWRLFKARHLLELAGLNAHWSTDTASTVAMLSEADAILSPLHNPALIDVRKTLAKDIHAIQSAPTTDITALLTQLNAARNSTWQLSIHPLPEAPSTESHPRWQFLSHLVTIRHTSDQLAPKPTLAYEALLRASIRMDIQEAEWAVLERNNIVYQLALNQALHNLKQSIVSDKARTDAMIKLLTQLKTISLYPDPIVPTATLTALNQVIQTTENKQPGDAS